MPAGHPLIEDVPGQPPSMFELGAGASALGAGVEGSLAAGPTAAAQHQTHLWVGGILLFSLFGLIALHVTGFRFSTDVGVTKG